MSENKTYRIGEVGEMLNLKTYVLRFWESTFPQIQPLRTPSGQRVYGEEQIALLRHIRSLLHERGMTIEGAKRILEAEEKPVELPDMQELRKIQAELEAIRDLLLKAASV